MRLLIALSCVLAGLALSGAASGQDLAGPALVRALQGGGYVIVMRHASSPFTKPADSDAEPDNVNHERQLDETGRKTASAMGEAIRTLHIPIGEVWSSPTYRALQTVRLARLPKPRTAEELGDRGQSMQAAATSQSAWLIDKAAHSPRRGTDTMIVTHYPNIMAAFGQAASGLGDGEALVFLPDGERAPNVAARIKIEDWPRLEAP